MELIPARGARLVRELTIGGDGHDGIADGALGHALKVQGQILTEEGEAVDDGGGLEVDDCLRGQLHLAEVLFRQADASRALHLHLAQRESWRDAHAHLHGLVVDGVCCCHLDC